MISKLALATILIATPVLGHDWYPPNCCGGTDCRPVPCADIEMKPDGSAIYKPEGAYFGRVKISQDAQCHVCTHISHQSSDGHITSYGYCAFIPGTS